MLASHLQKLHLQAEMPYKCAGCDYKSSSHHLTINHFYKKHNTSGLIQCPFCLKMTLVCNADGPIAENVTDFMKHLKAHFNKTNAKKCPKCALQFLTRGALKVHGLFAHVPAKGSGIKPITKSSTNISKPKVGHHHWKFRYGVNTVSLYFTAQGGRSEGVGHLPNAGIVR